MSGGDVLRSVAAVRGAVATLALLTGCATVGTGGPLGVEVVGEGSEVRFSWGPDHPWAGRFATQASQYRLFAQYVADGRKLEQELAVAKPASKNSWAFTLPAELRAVPQTEICLLIGLARGGQVVPLRAGNSRLGADTARFRFPEWEGLVKAQSATAQQSRSASQAEASVRYEEERAASLAKALASRGITSKQNCDGLLSRQPTASPSPGFGVEAVPDVATKVCVRRTRNLRRLPTSIQTDMPALAADVLQDTTVDRSDPLRTNAGAFMSDWNRWQVSTGAAYTPEIGDADDLLPVGGILAQQIISLKKSGVAANAATKRSLLAGLLSTYNGCVEDSQKQLKVKLAAWEQERVNKPLRDKIYGEQLYKACLNDVDEVDRALKAASDARAKLAEVPRTGPPGTEARAPARASALTEQTCAL